MDTPIDNGEKRNPDGTFAPGWKGGPGRPPGSISIMGKIKQIWAEDPERFNKWVEDAMNDKTLRRELIQQVDGKPVQPIAGVEGQPIVLKIVKYGDNDSSQVPTETIPT